MTLFVRVTKDQPLWIRIRRLCRVAAGLVELVVLEAPTSRHLAAKTTMRGMLGICARASLLQDAPKHVG